MKQILLALVTLGVSACASMGPSTVTRDRFDYTEAVAESWKSQMLLNLVANAVKFTPRGGNIRISAEPIDDRIEIHVTDSGIGVPADKMEAIFEPFVQLGGNLTRVAEGTGLGLAISRELARAMGGDVTVRSTLGAGASFTLTLPRA